MLPVKRLDPERNPLLCATLPDARNLLISPMIVDGRPVGAIVVEHRSRSIFGVERRVASVLGQFSAVAALNLRNAVLLRHVQNLAERDSLTGAANRRMFQETLEKTLADAPPEGRRHGRPVPGPGRLQARERLAGPRRRRRAAGGGDRSDQQAGAPAMTWWPGWAATSSPS